VEEKIAKEKQRNDKIAQIKGFCVCGRPRMQDPCTSRSLSQFVSLNLSLSTLSLSLSLSRARARFPHS